ncbi:MAG: hypothetical protein ACK55K_02255, partial [Bacteroidota bacterium]
MKYKILIRFFLFNSATIFVLFASAQKKYPVSVQEAVNMALVNTIDLKNLRLDSAKQRAKNKEITGLALPQITGSAQGAHYLTLPFVLFPSTGQTDIYNVLSKEGVKDGNGNPIQPQQQFFVQEFSFVQP